MEYPDVKEEDMVRAFITLFHETSKIHHDIDFAYRTTAINLNAKMFRKADVPFCTMLVAAVVLEYSDIKACVGPNSA